MVLRQVSTLDLASVEAFQTELIRAGFEPVGGDLREWDGPTAECLAPFTDAATMTIRFHDGWPFQHPRLFVRDLDAPHVNAAGELCLWGVGAVTDEWLTFSGFVSRIEEWAHRAATNGFGPEDFALDAHLAFEEIRPAAMATVDLGDLRLRGARGGIVDVSGRWATKHVLEVVRGSGNPIQGRAYWVAEPNTAPRCLDDVRSLLSTSQRNNFDRRYRGVADGGRTQLFIVGWDRQRGEEALVVLAEKRDERVVTESIQIAPVDTTVLKLRAGPDQDVLSDRCVVVFGVGAIGSHLACRLADSGIGRLVLVDSDRLRPGDVVRHAADRRLVGFLKVHAVNAILEQRAPWTAVQSIAESPWSPDGLAKIIEGSDCVVDATGLQSFTSQLSLVTDRARVPLVATALHQSGAISRVRRQATADDTLISDRSPDTGHRDLPSAPEAFAYEPGCSAPVNNAPPVSVAAAAARTASVVVDFLTGTLAYSDEVIEVLRPLDVSPFDQVGLVAK